MSQYRVTLAFCVLALSSFACSSSENRPARDMMPVAETTDANNTAMNERDRYGNTMTADRQREGTRSDVEITREIRQQIVKDDSFSSAAKNVKIITKNGIVNLRGPVENATERSKIGSIARKSAGVTNVENSLEIKRQ